MNTLKIFTLCLLTVSCALGTEMPKAAIETKSTNQNHAVTISERTNGCRIELTQIVQGPLKGYWTDYVYVADKPILRIVYDNQPGEPKSRSLIIMQCDDCGVVQVDRDLDGKYEMLMVIGLKDGRLIDVVFVTDDGWLRHGTPEEFKERQDIAETNRRELEEFKTVTRDAMRKKWKEMKEMNK